jgi:hypothetical protein
MQKRALQARLPHSHILAGYYESELGLWQLQSVNVLIASGFYFDDLLPFSGS